MSESDNPESENYLDIIRRMGVILPEKPGDNLQEVKNPYGKIPFFCPRCDEIRGTEDKGTCMQASHHEELMWKSFGMCSACYLFSRDNPELAAINQTKWKEKKEKLKEEAKSLRDASKYRVYFEDNTKFGRSSYVNSFSPIEFSNFAYPYEKPVQEGQKPENIFAVKSKKKVTLEEAEKIVKLIQSKDIEAWFVEEETPNILEL